MDWRIRFDGFGGGWTKDRVLESCAIAVSELTALSADLRQPQQAHLLLSLPPGQIWRWLDLATAARWTILPLCAWLLMRAPKAGQTGS